MEQKGTKKEQGARDQRDTMTVKTVRLDAELLEKLEQTQRETGAANLSAVIRQILAAYYDAAQIKDDEHAKQNRKLNKILHNQEVIMGIIADGKKAVLQPFHEQVNRNTTERMKSRNRGENAQFTGAEEQPAPIPGQMNIAEFVPLPENAQPQPEAATLDDDYWTPSADDLAAYYTD